MGLAAATVAAAGIGAIGSIVGGSVSASGATAAAKLQAQRYTQTRTDLAPYTKEGQAAFANYNAMFPFSFNPTMAQLEQTPGYQFALTQGLKSVQNGATARGLGVSGASIKGGAAYATGLADQTYQQQFGNAVTGYTTNANKLLQGAIIGENAGAQTGSVGATLAGTQGQYVAGAAGALGAGIQGAASSLAYPFYAQNPASWSTTAPGGYIPQAQAQAADTWGLY